MDDLIAALQILRKYGNPNDPTHCEHDVMMISPEINPESVSNDDLKKLDKLGFFACDDEEYGERFFKSYRFGSA